MLMCWYGVSYKAGHPPDVSRQEQPSDNHSIERGNRNLWSTHCARRYPDMVTGHERLQIISDRLKASLPLEGATLPEDLRFRPLGVFLQSIGALQRPPASCILSCQLHRRLARRVTQASGANVECFEATQLAAFHLSLAIVSLICLQR